MVVIIHKDVGEYCISVRLWCKFDILSFFKHKSQSPQSMVSCHTYAWQIGPFWQDTIEIFRCDTDLSSVSGDPCDFGKIILHGW